MQIAMQLFIDRKTTSCHCKSLESSRCLCMVQTKSVSVLEKWVLVKWEPRLYNLLICLNSKILVHTDLSLQITDKFMDFVIFYWFFFFFFIRWDPSWRLYWSICGGGGLGNTFLSQSIKVFTLGKL